MTEVIIESRTHTTPRHTTAYLEAGPADGPLMIFLHGFPGLSTLWGHQITHFASRGWRCIAPDLRGYGGSSAPVDVAAYDLNETFTDILELHDSLGGTPAVWVGHDWGSELVWTVAAKEAARCVGAASLTVPYIADGFTLNQIVPFVDRSLYAEDQYPLGQWEYIQFTNENPEKVAREFSVDVRATFKAMYRCGDPASLGTQAFTAPVRAAGGWFAPGDRAPDMELDEAILPKEWLDTLVEAYEQTGFLTPGHWYTIASQVRESAELRPNGGRLSMPVLYVHATWDRVCDTVDTSLCDPMRIACDDLTEVTLEAGHWVFLEAPDQLNTALQVWLAQHDIAPADAQVASVLTSGLTILTS
jgi:pimeloyl-ACP methyl ester carboxylesterase